MKTRRVDVVVIGAGTAGLSALDELDHHGLSLLAIDHGPLGTTCIRVGCMPSKALLHAGRRWSTADALMSFDKADGARARDRLWDEVRAIRKRLVTGEVEKIRRKLGHRLLIGSARFVAANAIEVDGIRIEAGAFVIATGSQPVLPDELAELGDRVLTTDTLFDVDRLPASMGLLGLGNVGIEIGLALARLGVRVIAVDGKPHPAGIADPRIGRCAIRTFSREMTMHVEADAKVERHGPGLRMRVGTRTHVVERVLAAVGRKPDLKALDLAAAGIAWSDEEPPPIDTVTLRLANSSIFVAGDASPKRPLLHEAIDEGVIAARGAMRAIRAKGPKRIDPRRTPLDIVFTDPDIVQVGRAFDELDPDRICIGTAAGDHNGRSAIDGSQDNLVRLYANRRDGRLLGAAAITVGGEHLAHLIALAIDRGLTASDMLAMPFYHPTFEELVQAALKDIEEQREARKR